MDIKPWYKSKTIWYAIITGVAGVVAAFSQTHPSYGLLAAVNSGIVIILRVLSTQALS